MKSGERRKGAKVRMKKKREVKEKEQERKKIDRKKRIIAKISKRKMEEYEKKSKKED